MPSPLRRGAVAALGALVPIILAATPAAAQQEPTREDLRALVYYAAQGDTAAAAAELRRLRALYPGWSPSENPAAAGAGGPDGTEIDAIYRAIAEKRVAEAQSLIETARRRHPSWAPPPDMTRLIDLEIAQADFDKAVATGDAASAERIARATPALRRCDRVDNVWRLAVLEADAGRRDAALTAYRGVLAACPDFAVASATLEKSAGLADAETLRGLFADVRPRFPAQTGALDALEARLLAGLGAPASTASTAARAETRATPRVADGAAKRRAASAPSAAPRAPRDPAQLPARGDKRIAAVLEAVRNEDWAGCLRAAEAPRSVEVLYQRAWCVFNLGRKLEAIEGFRIALGSGLDARARGDAAYGMALAYVGLGATDDAARVAAAHDMTRAQRVEIESAILDQRGVRAYEDGRYDQAIAFFDELEALRGSLRGDLAMLRGYAYRHLGDHARSHRQFRSLHDAMSSEATRAALRDSVAQD